MATNVMSISDWDPVGSVKSTKSFEDILTEVVSTAKTEEDPLLLSCVLYRITNTEYPSVLNTVALDLTSTFVKENITEEDRIFAGLIRRHYNDKIVLTSLRGDRITPFRQDLGRFLSGEFKTTGKKHEFPMNFLGMLYKLPYFYKYDKELSTVFPGEYYSLKGDELNYTTQNLKLTLIKKIMSYRRSRTPHEYWFRDNNDDRVMLSMEARSSLADLFDHYLANNEHITVRGHFRAARKDTLEYYRACPWTLSVTR